MIIQESEAQRNADEIDLKGDYKLIYPNESLDRTWAYQEFIEAAQAEWNDFTTGKGRKKLPFSDKRGNEQKEEQSPKGKEDKFVDDANKPLWRGSGNT